MPKVDENYVERLCNAVAKTIVETFENLTIEDVNMYKLGYNKAIDDFAKEFNFNILADNNFMFDRVTLYKKIREIAEQLKGTEHE